MALGDASAADVGPKYDVAINGKGYCFADSIESSVPFRTHRAIYDITPTFVERQNVSNQYGDEAQDFFLTATQNDWSGGGTQLFYRGDAAHSNRFYSSAGLDVSVPGQAAIMRDFIRATNANNILAISNTPTVGTFATRASGATTSLKTIDSAGTVTDRGDPGAGNQSSNQWGICTDGVYTYIAGATKIRKATAAWSYSDFSATATNAGALAFHNNALYSCDGSVLKTYDGSGTATTLFTWKDATNTALTALAQHPKLLSWGGQLLIFFPLLDRKPKLYIYDGVGVSLVAELPPGSIGYDMVEIDGIVFLSGAVSDQPGGITGLSAGAVPAIWYWASGSTGELWRDTTTQGALAANIYGLPALGSYAGRLVFASAKRVFNYDLASGAIWEIGPIPTDAGPLSGQTYEMLASDPTSFLYAIVSSKVDARVFPGSTYQATATLVTSWFDFDSSLTKMFRGVTVDWASANDGTIAISYEIDDGNVTSLQSSAVSGTEYEFAANTSGRKIRLTLTVTFGSTAAPVIKRIYVRAAPILKQFASGFYILDCTGTVGAPRELRDGSSQPLTGYEQVQNLRTAARLTAPFTVVDKVNGSFTALIDLQDPEGFDVYEVHPNIDDPAHPGSYLVRLKVREV